MSEMTKFVLIGAGSTDGSFVTHSPKGRYEKINLKGFRNKKLFLICHSICFSSYAVKSLQFL